MRTESKPDETRWPKEVGAEGCPDGRGLQLAAVNGWRGPGALAIAVAHLGVATDFFSFRHLEPVAPLVDLFFVLSGLVIARAYSAKLARASAIPEYIVRRFGRIWPVQAATLMLLVAYESGKLAASHFGGGSFTSTPFARTGLNLPEAIPTNLLLLQSLGLHDRETWNFPSWSLSVEFATYMSFAAFCLVRPPYRQMLSVVTILASLVLLATLAPYGMRSTYDFGVFRCLAGFFAGTLCFDLSTRWRLPRWRAPTLVELAAVALTIAWLSISLGNYASFAAPLVFGLFVLVFVDGRGALSRLLATRPVQFAAELSFTIYMVHAPVLLALLAALHVASRRFHVVLFTHIANPLGYLPGAGPIIEVIHLDGIALQSVLVGSYTATVVVVSYVVYRSIEVPGRSLFARLAKLVAAKSTPSAGLPGPGRPKPTGKSPASSSPTASLLSQMPVAAADLSA